MAAIRSLIVNADDFGLSTGVNEAVIMTHVRGIVTSASLMVRQPAGADAAARCREHRDLSVGLHLDMGEWSYRATTWVPVYEVVPVNDPAAVAGEAKRQLERFRRLMGCDPTHIDSHQHVHRREPVRSVAAALAHELDVPLRHFTPEIRYCGRFYGQTAEGLPIADASTAETLIAIVESLPSGTSELACHPGTGDEAGTMYRDERAQEVKALCDPSVRAALVAGRVQLCSFREVASRRRAVANRV